ncbi:protein-tyrosine phosphatase-like protein, partial [Schizophyllum fasciatum]
ISADEIVPEQIYLGNLSAALSLDYRREHGITHILSVCPEYEPTKRDHLMIPVDDTEYDDLLSHLPKTCDFIQDALNGGGKVLVHCVMGVSRSSTVLAAYLMRAHRWSAAEALSFIKKSRPRVRPNYGFLRQLDVFTECDYAPSPENPAFLSWKRRHKQEMNAFLSKVVDTTSIIPDELYLSDDFPEDSDQAESLLATLGVTHMLTLSPACKAPPCSLLTSCENIVMSPNRKEELLLALPAVSQYISDAIRGGGIVLVHSEAESKACTAVCAYLMTSRGLTAQAARDKIEKDMPLFNATSTFCRNLELYEACGHKPHLEHPAVQQWL